MWCRQRFQLSSWHPLSSHTHFQVFYLQNLKEIQRYHISTMKFLKFHGDSSYRGSVKYDSMTHWLISWNWNLQRKNFGKKITRQIQGSKKWSPFIPNSHLTSPPASHSSPSFQSRFFFGFSLARLRGSTPGNAKVPDWEKKTPEDDALLWFLLPPPSCVNNLKFLWEPRSNLVSPFDKSGGIILRNPMGQEFWENIWNSVVWLALIAQLQMSKSLGLHRFTSFLRVYSSNSPRNDHHNPMFCLMSRCLGLKKQKPYKPSTKTLESTSHLFWWMMLGTIYPQPQPQRPTAQNHGSSLPILWLQLHPSETADDLGNWGQPIVVSGGATLDLSNVLHSLQEICFGGNLIPKKVLRQFPFSFLKWGPVLYFHDFVGGESMGWNVFTHL